MVGPAESSLVHGNCVTLLAEIGGKPFACSSQINCLWCYHAIPAYRVMRAIVEAKLTKSWLD